MATRTEVVILRHVGERSRSSNTGRVAAQALAGSHLVDFGERDVPPGERSEHRGEGATVALPPGRGRSPLGIDEAQLRAPGTWLVYPEGPPTVTVAAPPARLIFLDATWPQARRMRQRVLALRGLPILHLAIEDAPAERLRESPGGSQVSTIEAIAAALALCGDEAPAAELRRLFALHVVRTRAAGGR